MDYLGLALTLLVVCVMLGIVGYVLYLKYYVGRWYYIKSQNIKYRFIGSDGKPVKPSAPAKSCVDVDKIQNSLDAVAKALGVDSDYFKSYSLEFSDFNLSRKTCNPLVGNELERWTGLLEQEFQHTITRAEYLSQSPSAAGCIVESENIIRVVIKKWFYSDISHSPKSYYISLDQTAIKHELLHAGLKLRDGDFDRGHTNELWKEFQ